MDEPILIDAFARLAQRNAELREFALSMLNPEQFGYSVTPEVRDAARRLLGIKPCETLRARVAPATVPEPQTDGGEQCSRPPAP